MSTVAKQLTLSGQVQGVGFRPFIYRIALENNLTGWVRNCVGIVEIHVQGHPRDVQGFQRDIFDKAPPLARPVLDSEAQSSVEPFDSFSILDSRSQGDSHITVPADLFLCDDCLSELNDPENRRYRYPFINCTQCGPRYTLIKALPYDRVNTTMAGFDMCPQCRAEYEDPGDRRFHAEPIACPVCGPSLSYHSVSETAEDEAALTNAVSALRQGKVIAVKGIGGYHLMCDAGSAEAVGRLRNNKPRPHKPLAVMFPAPAEAPFEFAEKSVTLSPGDKAFLLQPARPILLVQKKTHPEQSEHALSEQVAPGLNEVGMMLPYSPLHHLLLNEVGSALVATSANISGEPVLIHNHDVEKRLAHVADVYLHHDRPIERPADDPVYRTIAGKPRPIRTGRGSAPIELILPFELEQPVLAVGSHMKNVIALGWDNRVVISPHIGEMDTARSLDVFEDSIEDLQKLYDVKAEQIICDAHPGYTTSRWASKQARPVHRVLHHQAHASAAYYECNAGMAEKSVLVFTWDGVGYGEDGTLWGGETFLGKPGKWQRVASMRSFKLPGGDKAGRQPWRSAAALCWGLGLDYDDIPGEDSIQHSMLRQAWQREINTPRTSSVGRLFDAAAALIGVCKTASYEGQGPMQLEALCDSGEKLPADFIELDLEYDGNLLISDWKSLIPVMLDSTLSVTERALLFHHSLAHTILQQARNLRDRYGVTTVSFSGGVFQNRVLTEKAISLLSADGFEVYLPELIPVNDAGISFGQIMEYGFKQ